MRDQQALMVDKQKSLISILNENQRFLQKENDRLTLENEQFKPGYTFYMMIQNACKNSPVVAEEFQRFLVVCKLVEEDSTPGLTCENAKQLGFNF